MKHILILTFSSLALFFLPHFAFAGDICGGDFFCELTLTTMYYAPYYLALLIIVFFIFKFFKPSFSLFKKIIYSLLAPLLLLVIYHFFLSIQIEKFGIKIGEKNRLQELNQTHYYPKYIPESYTLRETRVTKHVNFFYVGTGATFYISEYSEKATNYEFSPPTCHIAGKLFMIEEGSGSTTAVEGNCHEVVTPKGHTVYLMTYNLEKEDKLAAVVLKDTLIAIHSYDFPEQELVKIVDSLEEKDSSSIEIVIPSSRFGR